MNIEHYFIVLIGSAFAGALNTLAGNGSAITLTILTELLGLPPNIANGTNRIGVASQSIAGVFAFHKNGKLDIQSSSRYIIPTIIGSLIGIIVATQVTHAEFKSVFSWLMVAMLFVILTKPKRWLQPDQTGKPLPLWAAIPIFLALGFYGGFIQMGMGVFFLGAMVLGAKYTIIRGNAVKLFVVAFYTIIAIGVFQWRGLIDWKAGLLLAVGQTLGGYFMATYAARYPKADVWAYRLLIVVVILAIIQLFKLYEYFM